MPLLNGRVAVNLLARDAANAREVWEATEGHAVIGVLLADHPSVEAAVRQVRSFQEVIPVVSVGLGAGDPNQWQRVADTALQTDPGHVNQVFPVAGYTVGALRAKGMAGGNVVNALVSPTGIPGRVIISTGPRSSQTPAAQVDCATAAAMLAEVGVDSVKFFPIEGDARLHEVAAMAKAAAEAGIPVFEPTGGITVANVARVVETCLKAGSPVVVPHIYSAIIDKETGRTRPADAAALLAEICRVFG